MRGARLPRPAWRCAAPDVELLLTAAPAEVSVFDGAPTRVWRFTGRVLRGPASALQVLPDSYLGPTIRLVRGQRVRIRYRNGLNEPSIVHWHGLDVPEQADGHPRLAVNGGAEYVYDFEVTNRAGTYWYHPHPHMRTGAQVYQGLAGLLLVSDEEEGALELPSGDAELTLVLQDRRVDAANQFVYAEASTMSMGGGRGMGRGMMGGGGRGIGGMAAMMQTMNGWLGDRVLVNGRPQPSLAVDRRSYRLRLLNGSNARIYALALSDGSPLTLIGGDGGLRAQAREVRMVTLAPGQRADVLLDLSSRPPASTLRLVSLAYPAAVVGRVGMMGETAPLPQGAPLELMTLRVSSRTGPRTTLPPRLCAPPAHWAVQGDAPVRRVELMFMQMNWLLGGRTFELEQAAPDETVAPGSTHVWEFVNRPNPMGMAMAHPIHLHGTQFGATRGRARSQVRCTTACTTARRPIRCWSSRARPSACRSPSHGIRGCACTTATSSSTRTWG
ncbi:MAG: multicopper oxidase domain-containing protein [Vicinamibacterales bacterium]